MAGAITVIDRDRAMFKYVFPTWGCLSLIGEQLRFRAKLADYASLPNGAYVWVCG